MGGLKKATTRSYKVPIGKCARCYANSRQALRRAIKPSICVWLAWMAIGVIVARSVGMVNEDWQVVRADGHVVSVGPLVILGAVLCLLLTLPFFAYFCGRALNKTSMRSFASIDWHPKVLDALASDWSR